MELVYVGLFILQLFILYFVSRITITRLFQVLRRLFHHDKIVYNVIALIFFPGTVIHELSHFLMAVILFLKVRDIHVFPEWEGNYLKLGRVYYEKKDVFRSILVGIAPVVVGLLFLWWISALDIFTTHSLLLQIIGIYILFILSTTMFSSKQDLIDVVYLIPLGIVLGGIIYVFQIDVGQLIPWQVLLEGTKGFVYAINSYLLISLVIHIVMIFLLNSVLFISRKL